MSRRGRPKVEYNQEEIYEMIQKYLQEKEGVFEIKPYAFHIFVQDMYEKGELKTKYASSFWRSQTQLGRQLIDKWNDTLKKSMESETEENVGFYNTEALLETVEEIPKKAIIKKLKLNEMQGRKFAQKYTKKQKECDELKKQVEELKQQLQDKNNLIERLEATLFDLTVASTSKRSKLTNQLDIREGRSAMVKAILQYSLGDLDSSRFDAWLDGKAEETEGNSVKKDPRVVNFQEKKSTSAYDDFSF